MRQRKSPGIGALLAGCFLAASAPSVLWGCSCLPGGEEQQCGRYSEGLAIFVARVIRDSGEYPGHRPGRVAIEEVLQNVPAGLKQVEVDTQAGTSCYFRLVAGERYVILSRADSAGRYGVHSCSKSFALRGNEHVFDAMRSIWKGGPSVLVGRVSKSTGELEREGGVVGASVVLEQYEGKRRIEVLTNGEGVFQVSGLSAGRYRIAVTKPGFVADEAYNKRWSGRMFLDKASNRIEPEANEFRETVLIYENACSVWDMSMWPAGTIEGTVRRKRDGTPAEDIIVQAFPFDRKTGIRPSDPFRTARSQVDGHYSLTGLPRGDYIIAVNGEPKRDTSPYPPAFHNNDDPRLPVSLITEGGTLQGIDLAIGEPRISGTLRVLVRNEKGEPQAGAHVRLVNPRGEERWSSRDATGASGEMAAPVYKGEHYIVSATNHTLATEGSASVTIPPMQSAWTKVEIVLRPMKKKR